MEYKDSLFLIKTDFEMRGNLATKEPLLVSSWEKDYTYKRILKSREGKQSFVLHDGPPYANGNIHCGHLINKCLKDFVIRSKTMQGLYVPFRFGWDTHGLPIENAVIKSGVNRKTTPLVEFRKKCEEFAYKQIENQKSQFKRLGLFGDFSYPYMTLTHDFEASQIEVFKSLFLKGYIYKGLKPVYWSPSSESALAESEIEYKDVEAFSIYVSFKVKDGKGKLDKDDSLIIWTTTPWTIPSNLAISLNPSFEYGLYKTEKGKFLVAVELSSKVKEDIGFNEMTLLKTFKGQELERIVCTHPLSGKDSLVLVGNHVTADSGSGCVHTAPGHGLEDYEVCLKYDIHPYCPVDEKGIFDNTVPSELVGKYYEDCNEIVIEMLTKCGALLKMQKFMHSYPHDWRTGKPLLFRATKQWFMTIESLKEQILKEIKEIKWKPKWGETRMTNMINERKEWCISRQRVWGVPIPIIYGEDKEPVNDEKVFDHIIELFKEHGSNIWYEKEAKDLLPEGFTSSHSPNGKFTKEEDIMDVWFDSGSSFNNVLVKDNLWPADLYLEGNDQYRGWFNSSIILSTAYKGQSPFKSILTHGFVVDENWDKMSKSKGNGIDPNKVAGVYGADILRLWSATIDYQEDAPISENIIKQVSEVYRKIRNTFRFMLGSLNDKDGFFSIEKDGVKEFSLVDTYILEKLEQVKKEIIDSYNEYEYKNITNIVNNFFVNDLSNFYLDYAKDILYCDAKSSLRRRQIQTVIYNILESLVILLTPILPFTCEEINKFIPNHKKENCMEYVFPSVKEKIDENILSEYKEFIKYRDLVAKALEEKRASGVIGSSLEAYVDLTIKNNILFNKIKYLSPLEQQRLFVVSKLTISEGEDKVEVKKATGFKCARCWTYTEEEHLNGEDHLCSRCHEVINGK